MSKTPTAQEFEALRAQLEAARSDLDATRSDLDAARNDFKRVSLERDLLQEQLRAFLRKLYAAKSEARTSGQQELFNEAESLAPEAAQPAAAEQTHVPAHRRAKPGRKPLDPALPRELVRHELPAAERICPHDGQTLTEIGVEASEQLDIVPASIRVIRHERVKYACPCCDGTIKLAPAPQQILPKSLFTAQAQAWIVTAKYEDGLPLYRQAALLKRVHADLSRSTLATTVVRLGQEVTPVINLLREHLLGADLIYGDETTVQVLKEPGKKAQTKSSMWVQMNGSGPPVRLFTYAPGRSAAQGEAFYEGIRPGAALITDGYEAYNIIAKTKGLIHLGCWAHARRYFIEAEAAIAKALRTPDQLATRFIALIGKLYRAEERARAWSPARRLRLRRRYSTWVIARIERLLLDHLHAVTPTGLLGKALHYLAGQWPKLIRFVQNGAWPIDTNPVENAIRPFVVGRKNWLFADSVAGATASANLYSLIETAKANGIEPYHYLVALFERIPLAHTVDDYEALMPWNIDLPQR